MAVHVQHVGTAGYVVEIHSADIVYTTGGVTCECVKHDHNLALGRGGSGRIVDVFGGKEYLFTATVNENGEIHLAKNSSISQEMIRRYNVGEKITLRPV